MNEEKIYDPDKMQETQRMLGGIAVAEWQAPKTITAKETGEQFEIGEALHIEIELLDKQSKNFHEWYPYTVVKNSKYGKFMEALQKLKISIKSEKDLIGKVLIWEKQIIEFGDMKSKPTWMPVALPESMRQKEKVIVGSIEGTKGAKSSFEEFKKQRQALA